MGFKCSIPDPSLFIYHTGDVIMALLLYVDDIILTGSSDAALSGFVGHLSTKFAIKDLGHLHYFLGVELHKTDYGLFLNQTKYALDILQRAQMQDCNMVATPMAVKNPAINTDTFRDPHLYRSLTGALQYLTFTRPDLAYSINYLCQFMHSPSTHHFKMLKRVLRYVKGTTSLGMHIQKTSDTNLNCISWCAKKQPTVARSSAEAEYRSMASATAELTWITYLLRDLGIPLHEAPSLFCDNLSALHLTVNPIFHARTKHIQLDYHFVRDKVAQGTLVTHYVPSTNQLADLFTKPLSRASFLYGTNLVSA